MQVFEIGLEGAEGFLVEPHQWCRGRFVQSDDFHAKAGGTIGEGKQAISYLRIACHFARHERRWWRYKPKRTPYGRCELVNVWGQWKREVGEGFCNRLAADVW